MIGLDASGGELEGLAQLRVEALERGLDLLPRHFETGVRHAVERLAVASHCRVAIATHVVDDPLHRCVCRQFFAEHLRRAGSTGRTQFGLAGGPAQEDATTRFFGALHDAHV